MSAADEYRAPFPPPFSTAPQLTKDVPPPKPPLLAIDEPTTLRPYIAITAASLALGLLAVLLFWKAEGLGINLFAATLAGSSAALVVLRQTGRGLQPRTLALLGGAIVFSALFTWRSSESLSLLNLLLVLLLGGLAISPSFGSKTHLGISTALLALKQSLASAIIGGFKWFYNLPWSRFGHILNLGLARMLIRGLLLATPLVLVFGMLFRSADHRFEWLIQTIIVGFIDNFFGQTMWFAIGALVSAGLLRLAGLGRAVATRSDGPPRSLRLQPGEATVCLTIVNLLFFLFVCLQLPYLFGGLQHVVGEPGLTMANYARRGFFELATVAALVLPMLLGADWLLSPDATSRQRRWFRIACSALLVLLAIIMASALQRMLLYMHEFGLTQLRLFVSVFIVMLATVFAWFGFTVLRDRREHFLAGAMVIGAAFAFGLQVSNPDARIATYNLERCRAGHTCDFPYLAQLSSDALPAIAAQVKKGGIPESAKLIELLKKRHAATAPTTWQSWNHSRASATTALTELAAPTPPQAAE